jgi:hypothetical protein
MTWRGEKSCPSWDSNFNTLAVLPIASECAEGAFKVTLNELVKAKEEKPDQT